MYCSRTDPTRFSHGKTMKNLLLIINIELESRRWSIRNALRKKVDKNVISIAFDTIMTETEDNVGDVLVPVHQAMIDYLG